MGRSILETLIGAIVILVAAGFGYFAYNSSSIKQEAGYDISAKFDSVDGIGLGSEVRMGGVKIGVVTDLALEPETYLAVLSLHINEAVKLPEDSNAAIVSDGLLGAKYVALTPGSEEAMLKDDDQIQFTQSSVNLEAMIGKFMFSGGGVDKDGGAPAGPESEPVPSSGL
ncbi:MAG: outer membrane lipid asymmetry maintenance protein MlaD [Alphaproteobacteria bacterium]|nr:outer membrane lipid asymmetry maintenance protein MlaD [Alphaproteobacteria bacterium]